MKSALQINLLKIANYSSVLLIASMASLSAHAVPGAGPGSPGTTSNSSANATNTNTGGGTLGNSLGLGSIGSCCTSNTPSAPGRNPRGNTPDAPGRNPRGSGSLSGGSGTDSLGGSGGGSGGGGGGGGIRNVSVSLGGSAKNGGGGDARANAAKINNIQLDAKGNITGKNCKKDMRTGNHASGNKYICTPVSKAEAKKIEAELNKSANSKSVNSANSWNRLANGKPKYAAGAGKGFREISAFGKSVIDNKAVSKSVDLAPRAKATKKARVYSACFEMVGAKGASSKVDVLMNGVRISDSSGISVANTAFKKYCTNVGADMKNVRTLVLKPRANSIVFLKNLDVKGK